MLAEADVSDADIDAFVRLRGADRRCRRPRGGAAGPEFAEVDGLRRATPAAATGRGVPVLFIHGFGGDLDNWLFNLDAVAEAAR